MPGVFEEAGVRFYIDHSKMAAEIAERLGLPKLAAEFRETIRGTEFAELPVELCIHKIKAMSFVIAPNSCRKRWSVALRRLLVHAVRSSRTKIQKLRLLCAELAKPVKRVFD